MNIILLSVTPLNNLSKELMEQINNLRSNPKGFLPIIEIAQDLITDTNKDEISKLDVNVFLTKSFKKICKFKLLVENICNVGLNKGKEQFESVSNVLRTLQGMNRLEFRDNLCLEIPDKLDEIGKREHITKSLEKIESCGDYSELSFHYDIGVQNPLISVVLQVIDDSPFKGLRTRNLLNGNKQYLGISCKKVEGLLCAYFLFAE